mmetsp:Transcript_28060/g.59841  ORF Transcript_28060/g.59841 Transcript_28060/m.59841 type:complete len:96 (-) Transcript_28060:180-467(-)
MGRRRWSVMGMKMKRMAVMGILIPWYRFLEVPLVRISRTVDIVQKRYGMLLDVLWRLEGTVPANFKWAISFGQSRRCYFVVVVVVGGRISELLSA